MPDDDWLLLAAAAGSGQVAAVQFMLQHDDIAENLHAWYKAMTAAVASGSVETAAYLRRAGCGAEVEDAWAAAPSLHDADMLGWLLKGARLDAASGAAALTARWAGRSAAMSAKLMEVVRWLGASADQSADDCALGDVVRAAAAGGELGLTRYLHEELGIELVPSVLGGAARSGCEELVEWLVERINERGKEREADRCYLSAALNGDLAMLRCLQRVGMRWGPKAMLSVVTCQVPSSAVQWIWGGPGAPPFSRQLVEEALRATERAWPEARAQELDAWLSGQLANVV